MNRENFLGRRLQDRVHELCSRALLARSQDELHTILQDLRAALHEHRNRLRKVAVFKLVEKIDGFQERRAA